MTAHIYAEDADCGGGAEAAIDIFESRSYLCSALLDGFVHAFSGSLQRSVASAATSLIRGSTGSSGLLATVRRSLAWLLQDHLRAAFVVLAQDFGLEALARLPRDQPLRASPVQFEGVDAGAVPAASTDALRSFTTRVLRTIEGLSSSIGGGSDGVVSQAEKAVRVTVNAGAVPPSLPLFAHVMRPLQVLVSDATAAVGGNTASHSAVERAAVDFLRDDPNLAALVRALESSGLLFERFQADILTQRLGFGHALPHEVAVLGEFIELSDAAAVSDNAGVSRRSVLRELLRGRDMELVASLAQLLTKLEHLRVLLLWKLSQRDETGLAGRDASDVAAGRLAAACSVARTAANSQLRRLARQLPAPDAPLSRRHPFPASSTSLSVSIVGAQTTAEFLGSLSAAGVTLAWTRLIDIGRSAAAGATADDATVQMWLGAVRPLLASVGSFAGARALLPPPLAIVATAMIVAVRVVAHMPLQPAALVFQAVSLGVSDLCASLGWPDLAALFESAAAMSWSESLGAAVPLTLLCAVGRRLEGDKVSAVGATSVAPPPRPWLVVLEDILRWVIGDGLAASAAGGMKAGWGVSGLVNTGFSISNPAGKAALGEPDVIALFTALLASHESEPLQVFCSLLPPRVRTSLILKLVPKPDAPQSELDALLRRLDAALGKIDEPPPSAEPRFAIKGASFVPSFLADAFAAGGIAPTRASAARAFQSASSHAAANALFNSLSEFAAARHPPGDALTLAQAYLTSADGHMARRSPAEVVWMTVLALRFLEVLAKQRCAEKWLSLSLRW